MLRVMQKPFDSIHFEYFVTWKKEIVIDNQYISKRGDDNNPYNELEDISFQFIPLRKVLKHFF